MDPDDPEDRIADLERALPPRAQPNFRPPPTDHSEEPDAYERMFGMDRKSFLLAVAIGILGLCGVAITVLSDRVPAMNEPAPSFVGPLFLIVMASIVAIALVRHFRRKR
jgi:hypothetical protein